MIRKWLKNVKWNELYMAMEYSVDIYALLVSVLNVLNITGLIQFNSWFMKPTFFGSSLLVLLLFQYGLINANRKNQILEKIRPYMMGLAVASIVSSCKTTLCYILLAVLGYFLLSGFQKKYGSREAALMALTACVGIEIYSIFSLMQANVDHNRVCGFLQSVAPDLLFVLTAVVYGIINKGSRKEKISGTETEIEKGEPVESELVQEEQKKTKEFKVLKRLGVFYGWASDNLGKIVRYAGGAVCVFSISLLLYHALTLGICVHKIGVNSQDVYVLENCQDSSYVLTAVQTEDPTAYNIVFDKNEGKNNQKVLFNKQEDGTYQVTFLEFGCAMVINEGFGLYGTSLPDSTLNWHLEEVREGRTNMLRFINAQGTPLSYRWILDNEKYPTLLAGNEVKEKQLFVVESTIWDEFATSVVAEDYNEFMPTKLIETIIAFFGRWVWVLFAMVVLTFTFTIYIRRIIGDRLAVLYGLLFLYMLAYESISVMVLLYITFGVQCHYAYMYKKKKRSENLCQCQE